MTERHRPPRGQAADDASVPPASTASTPESAESAESAESWRQRSAPQRAAFGGTLLLAMAMSPLVQYGVATLAPLLIEDLGISRTQLGTFASVTFVTSALTAPLLGRLVDRIGGRRTMVMLFALAGLAATLLASAPSYPVLLVTAAVNGLPMALAGPATNHAVQSNLPAGGRGLLIGVKQAGVKVGQVIAGLLLPSAALILGWRSAMVLLLPFAVWGVVASWSLVREPRSGPVVMPADRHALTQGAVIALACYGALMGAGQSAINTYLPLFAYESVGLSVPAAGLVSATVGALGIASRIGWARGTERSTSVGRILVLVALGAAASSVLLLVSASAGAGVLVAAAVLYGASAPVWSVVTMVAIVRGMDSTSVGRATGTAFLGFSMGNGAGPVLFAAAVDATSSYAVGWGWVTALFCAAALLGVSIWRREG